MSAATPGQADEPDWRKRARERCQGEPACLQRGVYRMAGVCCKAERWPGPVDVDGHEVDPGGAIALRTGPDDVIVIAFAPGAPPDHIAVMTEKTREASGLRVITVPDVAGIAAIAAREQEQTVQQQPFSMADHLHRLGDLIDSNPLVTRLLATGLGSRLTDADAGRIAAIVESIEKAREQQVLTYGGEAAQSGNAGQYPQTSAQPSFTAVPRLLPEAPQEDVVQ